MNDFYKGLYIKSVHYFQNLQSTQNLSNLQIYRRINEIEYLRNAQGLQIHSLEFLITRDSEERIKWQPFNWDTHVFPLIPMR